MPENANNIPLDDEDILDLTVVAETGKKIDKPPEPDTDFGADLDALLDSLGAGGEPGGLAQPAPPAQAAPIADQTPVDHAVDPDEELAMPEMSDIDSLLAELGAKVPTEEAAPVPAPEMPENSPVSAPMPEFDAILAQAQAAEAAKAEEEAQATVPMREPAADPFEAALSATLPEPEAAVAAPPAVDAETPAVKAGFPTISVSVSPLTVTKPAPAAQTVPPPADAVAEKHEDLKKTQGEDIDLNELDALLDDILSTAPEMHASAVSQADYADSDTATTSAEAAASVPDVIPVPDQAIMPVSEGIAALADRVQRLKEAVEALELLDLAALANKVQRLEEAVEVLESQEISEPMVEGLIDAKLDAKIAALFEPNSPVIDRILNEIMGRFVAGAFSEEFEKMAASAAAKVIREEIAALTAES